MGVKGLYAFLKKRAPQVFEDKDISFLSGHTLAIDTSIWVYQCVAGAPDAFMLHFKNRVDRLLRNGIVPIFIFDGPSPKLKEKTKTKRKETKNRIIVTREMFVTVKNYLESKNIKYRTAPSESEAYCAKLLNQGLVDHVSTEDSDIFCFGSKTCIRGINASDTVQFVQLKNILEALELTLDQYIDFCITLGCDYIPGGVKGVGPSKALSKIKNNEPTGVQEIEFYSESKKLFKQYAVLSPDFDCPEESFTLKRKLSFNSLFPKRARVSESSQEAACCTTVPEPCASK